MAITLGSSQENASAPPTSPVTVSINVGTRTNGLLKVDCVGICSNSISSMTATYAGTSMNASTRAENVWSSPNRVFAVTFYLAPPTNGTNNFVLTYSVDSGGSISELYILASWWDGAFQGTALDQQVNGSGSTDPSASITPTENNELVAGTYYSRANNVLSVGSGETLLQDHDFGGNVAGGSYVIQTTAAAQTVDFTGVDDVWVMKVTSFKQASSGVTVSLQAATITATGQVAKPSKRVSLAAGQITATGQVAKPSKWVALAAATITASGPASDIQPGAVTKTLQAGQMTAAGQVAKPSKWVALTSGQMTAAGQQATIGTAAPRTINLQAGQMTATGQVALPSRTVSLLAGQMTATGQVALPSKWVALSAGQVTATGQATTIQEGPVTVSLAAATITAAGQQISINAGPTPRTINLQAGQMTASGPALDVQPGAKTISLAAAAIQAAGQTATISLGGAPQTIGLQAGQVTSSGQALDVVPGSRVIGLGAATVGVQGQVLDILTGPVTISLVAGLISVQGQTIIASPFTEAPITASLELVHTLVEALEIKDTIGQTLIMPGDIIR